jgi:hypothetical protein
LKASAVKYVPVMHARLAQGDEAHQDLGDREKQVESEPGVGQRHYCHDKEHADAHQMNFPSPI